jgi:MGT family glycosyltransferase
VGVDHRRRSGARSPPLGLVEALRRSSYLTRFPASLDPSPFPDTRRFSEHPAASRTDLPDWWEGSRAPLVYVSFGTVLGYVSIAADVYRAALRAVAPLDARVLLTVGRRFDTSQLGSLPGNVHVESWVDQARVLTGAEVVVCHGGSGTTLGALAEGVPLVIVPMFADQSANGSKVAEAGAGVVIDTGHDADGRRPVLWAEVAPLITEAIETVRSDPSFRQHARRIADQMAAVPPADILLDELMPSR